ncbi:MAG: threonine/serine exporter family protein [Firmicutes bacterium]|nr:threonine/serine exporter family protein [Bacillota bacterium]
MMENAIQVLMAFLGSVGFAVFFRMKGKQIFFAGLGGAGTWIIYLLITSFTGGEFVPNLASAISAGIYAEIMARVNRAPATIFLTAAAVPLIPGGKLYYTMAALVNDDKTAFVQNGETAVIIALAIASGFVVVALASKYLNMLHK